MNKKGFTLIELIASILILALVMAIAIPAIGNMSRLIKERQRKNVVNEIEIAAAKYAFDTGETLIFVDKLVTDGYIESDDDGNVYDPSNSERMNCYLVEMEKKGTYYKAHFLDTNYDNNGVCDLDKLNNSDNGIQITVLNNGKVLTSEESNNYLKGEVKLIARKTSEDIDCTKNQCVWTSSGGFYKNNVSEIDIQNVTDVLNAQYNFQVTIYGEDGKIERYTGSRNIKIDNEKPTIYVNETKITNRFATNMDKDVTIVASDKGSGVVGYYIGTVSSCSADLTYSSQNTLKVIKGDKKNYTICVKDKVGNIEEAKISI